MTLHFLATAPSQTGLFFGYFRARGAPLLWAVVAREAPSHFTQGVANIGFQTVYDASIDISTIAAPDFQIGFQWWLQGVLR